MDQIVYDLVCDNPTNHRISQVKARLEGDEIALIPVLEPAISTA